MTQDLNRWFAGAAAKRLAQVEVNSALSNQHEFNISRPMREFLGEPTGREVFPTMFLYFSDDAEPVSVSSTVTYYDARAAHPTRSELRMYYPSNEVMRSAEAGDVWVLAAKNDGDLVIAVARDGSSAASQLLWLFGISLDGGDRLALASPDALEHTVDVLTADVLLDLLGIQVELSTDDDLLLVERHFGTTFPTTAIFSAFAREHAVNAPSPVDDPDGALVAWLTAEYRFFQAFERLLVQDRLAEGFTGDHGVDDFLAFSLSVQNRRKSRSGHSLENHLKAVLDTNRIPYRRGAQTERKAKPDFLFPSMEAYHDPTVPGSSLRMLAAKTTVKDRWRQVLAEADRIVPKHLITMQAAVSEDQTEEMKSLGVQLVVPKSVQRSFTPTQQEWLWSLAEFLGEVKRLS